VAGEDPVVEGVADGLALVGEDAVDVALERVTVPPMIRMPRAWAVWISAR